MKDNIFFIVIAAFVFIVSYIQYQNSDYFHLTCVVSDVNEKKYCVRQRSKLSDAANLLAKTSDKLIKVVDHMKIHMPNDPITKRIIKRFDPNKIKEILPTSQYTAYSENKGEKLAFCLNKEKNNPNSEIIDENTLMYVALHELSHVGCKSIGHNTEFWSTYKKILEQAVDAGVYKAVDYSKTNAQYCDMKITDNPLFS